MCLASWEYLGFGPGVRLPALVGAYLSVNPTLRYLMQPMSYAAAALMSREAGLDYTDSAKVQFFDAYAALRLSFGKCQVRMLG